MLRRQLDKYTLSALQEEMRRLDLVPDKPEKCIDLIMSPYERSHTFKEDVDEQDVVAMLIRLLNVTGLTSSSASHSAQSIPK